MCTSIHNYIYIHIHIYTIYYSVNGTIIHMQQWLRSYTLYIHTTYAYILHITHYTLGFGHIHYSYVRVWSTHQVSLKRPIGQWMTYLDHITWVWGVQQWQFIQVYRNKHNTQWVNSLVYIPSPPVEYMVSASTTVRANRETEWSLAPDGSGREVGYTSGQLWGRSRLRMEWIHGLTTANSHFEVVDTVQQGLSPN